MAAPAADAGAIKHVFVIAMENRDASTIYGKNADTPYITSLMAQYARAANFKDELAPAVPSEPHYVYMEAGTATFPDVTFATDDDPSASNSTASRLHLTTQLAAKKLTWMSYDENVGAATGACPIVSSGFYAAKHNPFVFFQDVSGSPPATSAVRCVNHMRHFSQLATDLKDNAIADYVFITPNLCDDMHGAKGCNVADETQAGDAWLSEHLPPILSWATANAGVIIITWDEPLHTTEPPFIVVGPGVKPGYASPVRINHGSMLKSVERIFGLPFLATVAHDSDLADFFEPGAYP